jgi:oligopeptide transport system substrate-binding protein
VAAVALAAVLGACSPSHPPALLPAASPGERVLRIGVGDALPTIADPATAPIYGAGIVRATYEPLLRLKPGGDDTMPGAAEKVDVSADGLTYTFHLRANARWSDGRPVTASDFRTAWRRVLDPRVNSPAGDVLAHAVKNAAGYEALDPVNDAARIPGFLDGLGLQAADDRTFVVTLARPAPWFRMAVTMPELAPVRVNADGSLSDAGNGAFTLDKASGTEIDFLPNDHYWAGRPNVDRLVLVPAGDPAGQLDAYRQGSFGALELAGAPAATARKDGSLARQLSEVGQLEVGWIQFNVHRAPFDNPLVRLAVAQAIDRTALVHAVLGDAAIPATSPVPKGMRGYQPGLAAQAFDSARCRTTLDSSGVTPAELQDVHLLVRDQPLDKAVAENVAQQVQAHLGVKLTLDVKPSTEVTKRVATGDFQAQGPGGWVADYPDEQDWMDLFLSYNFAGQSTSYSDPAYDRLVQAADVEPDAGKRSQLYAQAQQLMVQQAPVAFLYQPLLDVLHEPWVDGMTVTGMDSWPGDSNPGALAVTPH